VSGPAAEGEGGLEWQAVNSTAIEQVGFDAEEGEIHVVYKGGSEGVFPGTLADFEALLGSGSVGKAVNVLMGRTPKS
jgi:hypothetical protein